MTTTIALLRTRDRLVTAEGTPTLPFQNDWQVLAEEVEAKAALADPTFIGTATAPTYNATVAYNFAGVQLLTARKAGWTADTGTAKRTANATYAGTAEAAYTQATIQALMNALRDATQTIKALKDDLLAHGLLGA